MIFDKLQNAKMYKGLSGRLDKALQVAAETNFSTMENDKYEVDGDNIFYMVQRYQTKPIAQGKLEAHRKYIDIQIIITGREIIGYQALSDQQPQDDYDPKNDFILYDPIGPLTKLKLSSNQFCVFFPDDLHMPGITDENVTDIEKVVIKVKV